MGLLRTTVGDSSCLARRRRALPPTTDVASATLASTFHTSLVGAATFVGLSQYHHGSIALAWAVGITLGVGGLIGGYLGAWHNPISPTC